MMIRTPTLKMLILRLETLRDIDLEEQCLHSATHGDNMTHTRWCSTMAGEEYARIHSWGNDPMRKVIPDGLKHEHIR